MTQAARSAEAGGATIARQIATQRVGVNWRKIAIALVFP
jgi:hypothetical protein